ncbi:MAG: CoA-binding protein [Armatimonadota bacterium]|nr:MAG: CoA-binding protein [Armatimonadota bacterium]
MGKVADDDEALRGILTSATTIAVVGLSRSADKDSHRVASYLMAQGYRIIPVNPGAEEILEQRCFPDLAAVNQPVDVVQIFRPAQDVPPIVEQAIAAGARTVWMQLAIRHDAAAARAAAACLTVVQDRCMAVEHHRLIGGGGGEAA